MSPSCAMPGDLTLILDQLRILFRRHEAKCVLLHDDPTRHYLGTHEVRAKDGYRTWFGGIEIKKSYVSAHVIPVYVHPEMIDAHSLDLTKRMQGKSCFNFKLADAGLFAELDRLITAGIVRFEEDGRL